MIKSLGKIAVAGLLATGAITANASDVNINFDELSWVDGDPIGAAYAPVFFSANGVIAQDNGALGPVESNSVPNSLNFFDGSDGVMFVPVGLEVSSFAFWYSNPYGFNSTVTFSGGNIGSPIVVNLSNIDTLGTPFDAWIDGYGAGTAIAQFVTFGGVDVPSLAFDDISFDYAPEGWDNEQQPVPEPSTVIGGLALAALVSRRFFAKR